MMSEGINVMNIVTEYLEKPYISVQMEPQRC